jgi:acyl dehydratase
LTDQNSEAWNAAINQWLAEVNGKIGETNPAPPDPIGPYDMAISHRLVTEDLIKIFANAVGDANPLWRSIEYGRSTRWGGVIAPPIFESCISEMPSQPTPPQVRGWNHYNGGNTRVYFKPMRPGDEIRAEDTWLGVSEKTRPGRPHRLFLQRSDRRYLNQRDEIVCVVRGRVLSTATPPEQPVASLDDARFAGRTRPHYTQEQLDALHKQYDAELSGASRRGADTLYWDDVNEGDDLPGVLKGPYDVTDGVAFFGAAVGYSGAFAIKWAGLKSDLGRCPVDPETGEYHNAADWHLQDSIARVAGIPYALAFGTHVETMLSHAVTNWMGDAGFVTRLDTQLRSPLFQGDMSQTYGRVVRKYVEDEEDLVDLELWAETQDQLKHSTATATVRLPARRRGGPVEANEKAP